MGGIGVGVLASKGGLALALAIAGAAALRFLKWIIQRGDHGIAKRLKHLEQELDCYREATMMLINALAQQDPTNKALASAARILRKIPPRSTMELDELEARLKETQ